MKAVGIIAEYNPFHTGHEYHIKRAKEEAGAEYAIVIMSPDFVQRGEPAVFDKYTRARMALCCGADLVLELPVCYATGSAEYFAQGAVALLDRLGVADTLCFGAETDDIGLLTRTAGLLSDEPEEYRASLKEGLRRGLTFPQARSEAAAGYLQKAELRSGMRRNKAETGYKTEPAGPAGTDDASLSSEAAPESLSKKVQALLAAPNNILGVEYCRALGKMRSSMTALPIRRQGSRYDSLELSGRFASATAIRARILSRQPDVCAEENPLLSFIPEGCRTLFENACRTPLGQEDLLPWLTLRLLDGAGQPSCPSAFSEILDFSPELAARTENLRFSLIGRSFAEITALLKTRQLTEARVRRALLHLILQIRTAEVRHFCTSGTVFYAHILGLRRASSPLVREIKRKSTLPLITKTACALPNLPPCGQQMWALDLYASHLYCAAVASRYPVPFCSEYKISPVIL